VFEEARAFIKERAAKAGREMTDDQVVAELDGYLVAHSSDVLGGMFTPGGGITAPLRRRKDVPDPIRKLLGEVKNPGVVLQKTLFDQAALVSNFEIMSELSDFEGPNGERFATNKKVREFLHPVPLEAKFGAMAGKFVAAETRDALLDHTNSMYEGVFGWYDSFVKGFQKSKTAYSLGTHGRNVLGNFFFSEFANNSIWNAANWKYYTQAVQVLANKNSPLFKEVAKSGTLGTQFFTSPSIERALKRMQKELLKGDSPTAALKRLSKELVIEERTRPTAEEGAAVREDVKAVVKGAAEAVGKPITKVADVLSDLYIAEDQWVRVASYLKQRAGGKSTEDAARWTNLWFPDYDGNPKALLLAQRSGIFAPFLSFFAQVPRIYSNAVMHNPVKLGVVTAAQAAAATGMIGTAMRGLMGAVGWEPEREWGEGERADWQRMMLLQPEYAKKMIPFFTKDGTLKAINLQGISPVDDFTQFLNQATKNPVSGATEELTFGGPAIELVLKLALKRDSRGFPARRRVGAVTPFATPFGPTETREKLTEDATASELLKAAATSIAESNLPPLIVGSEANRINEAIRGAADLSGRKEDLFDATLGQTGIRPVDISWDARWRTETRKLIRDTVGREANASAVFKFQDEVFETQPDQVDIQELDKKIESMDQLMDKFIADSDLLDSALDAAERLGGTMSLSLSQMNQARISNKSTLSRVRNTRSDLILLREKAITGRNQ